MDWNKSSRISRRRLLRLFGVSAAGGIFVATDNLFAKQFARAAVPVRLPDMVYDPDLQVMVDPVTRQPLYSRAEMVSAREESAKPKPLPTVTAGCSTCPKCDDHCG